jgi:GNAT superfamily N-acetyltransferase
VFRTNVQAAASAARQTQMYKPAILARRPFGLIQTVDDNRRSKICTGLAGTLMPLDDPGWLTRTPPYHYNCRSLIRNITAEQAERLGGPTGWPAAMPMAGFGRATAMVGRQQVETVDASLRDILEARRIEETIDPLTTSPEISIPEPRATADAIRKVGLTNRWRSPEAVKRFVGIDRETFDEGAVSVSADRGAVTIHARNERVSVTRTIKPDGTVFHDSLKIAEHLRGQGIARGMLRTAAAEYVNAGISKVELLADDDGKFVWPKLGFRASPEAVAKQAAKFGAYLEKQGDKPLAAKSMQAIANHPKGEAWLKSHAPILYYEITPQELLDRLS